MVGKGRAALPRPTVQGTTASIDPLFHPRTSTDYRLPKRAITCVLPIELHSVFVFRSKSLRTPSNMFIVSLAIFDIIMAVEMPMFVINSFMERMIGWEIGCDIYAALGSISGMGQSITNAAIAFDRYRLRSSYDRREPCDHTKPGMLLFAEPFPARSMDGSTRNKPG